MKIRRARYGVILDIHNSLRSRYVRTFAGDGYVGVVNKRALARFALVKLKRNLYRDQVPLAERYLEPVRRYGIQDDGRGLEVFVPDETASSVTLMMDKYKLGRYELTIGI